MRWYLLVGRITTILIALGIVGCALAVMVGNRRCVESGVPADLPPFDEVTHLLVKTSDNHHAKALLLEGDEEIHQFIEAAFSCRPRRAASNAWNTAGTPDLTAWAITRSSKVQMEIYYHGPLTRKCGPLAWVSKRFVQIRGEFQFGRIQGEGRSFPAGRRWQEWLAQALPRMEPVWSESVWADARVSGDKLTARLRDAGYRPLTLIFVDTPPTTAWGCRVPIHVELPIGASIEEAIAGASAEVARRVAQLKERVEGLEVEAWANKDLEVQSRGTKVTASSSFTVYCCYLFRDLKRGEIDGYLKDAGLTGYSLFGFRVVPAVVVLKGGPKDARALQRALLAGNSGDGRAPQ